MKTCSSCHEVMQEENFKKSKSSKDGLSSQCKKCIKRYEKRVRLAKKLKVYKSKRRMGPSRKERDNQFQQGLFWCTDCQKWRDIKTESNLNRRTRLGIDNKCKICALVRERIRSKEPYRLYNRYKRDAGYRGRTFNLSFRDFMTFWAKRCYYCDEPILSIGLDRLNNQKGYILENCVPCCDICNYMKRKLSYEEFLRHIGKIHKHIEKIFKQPLPQSSCSLNVSC